MSSDVKVGIKFRPLIEREKDANLSIQWIVKGNSIVSFDQNLNKCEENEFHFDYVFDINATNTHIFNSITKPIADAALDGYNGTIFCYGQFGTGKTYTMTGSLEEPGIIPHTIEYIFNVISTTVKREFLLRVSYIEICDEQINDLLNKDEINLKLCKDNNGQVIVNCKEEITNSTNNMLSIMRKGIKNKRTQEINRNKCTASHSLFRIIIESQDVEAGSENIVQVSHLNFVDLAGFKKFHCTDPVQEHQTNVSLSTLESHIKLLNASEHPQGHTGIRHSKLTELLQSSLSGNAVTAIICTVTPIALEGTYYTLQFASQVKNIKSKPQKNEVASDAPLLIRYAKQLTKLQTELEKMENTCVETEEVESNMLPQKYDINYLLEERIKLLKSQIVSGCTRNCEEYYKHKPRRKQTWCNPGIFKQCLPVHHSKAGLPTIKEISPEKPYKKNIIQSVDVINQSLQTAFADFELELIDCEAVYEAKEDNVMEHEQDEYNIGLQSNNCFLTPGKQDSSVQTSSNHASPSTPKSVLRTYILDLTKDLSELREFTTLEKQIMCEENHLCSLISEEETAKPSTCSNFKCGDVDKYSSNLIVQLEEAKAKLTEDLQLKIQELDEIKNDIQSLKLDVEKLQETIYLLTNENMEMSNKLFAEKERSKEIETNLQRTIDNFYVHIAKITDEKINFESNVANADGGLQSSHLKISEDFNSVQVITNYQNKIDALKTENIELSAIIVEKDKGLESIKESKSLLYEHECIYKDKLAMYKEKNESLVVQNNKLTTDLMNTLEENDTLKEQCDILRNKMSSLVENTNPDESNIEQIKPENILKAEIKELKMKITILSEENAKFSHSLLETMEDLDNSRNEKLSNHTLNLSTELGSLAKGTDANKKPLYDRNYEELANKVIKLQGEVNHLSHLNEKLSDLKLSSCSQCTHSKNFNENRKALKIEEKIIDHKLEDFQKKFDRECADTEALKLKVNQELNFSFSDNSLNTSFVDGINVNFVEEKVQHLNNELQVLRNDHDKLSTLYQEKCYELVKLHDEVIDSKSTDNRSNLRKNTFKNETKIEQIQKSIDQVRDEIDELKKNNMNFASALSKFMAEKASLLDEINMLKNMNDELQQKMSDKEISEVTATKKAQILQSELLYMSKEIKQYSAKEKIIQTEKLTLEVELEDMKAEKKDRDVLVTGLHRTIDDLNECITSLKTELGFVTNQRNQLTNSTETIERKYKDELEQLQKQYNELEMGKQESTEAEIHATLWAKELKIEVDKLQIDLEKQESLYKELQRKVSELENLLQESKDEKTILNEKLRALEVQLTDSKDSTVINCKNEFEIVAKNIEEYTKESEIKLNKINETLNKYVEENDTLTQELTKFRDIESKFKDLKHKDECTHSREKTLITNNNKLKKELDTVKECMIKELKGLKYKVNSVDLFNKTADGIFIIFLQTIVSKEEEVMKKLRDLFEEDKQKLVDEVRQSADAGKRVSLWAKELESEIEKLQMDLTRNKELCKEQEDEVRQLEHLLKESEYEKETLKEKMDVLKFDYSNLQSEFEKECKVDIHQKEQEIILAQKREKEIQEAFKGKEIELLSKIKSEKEIYKREIEELFCTIQNYKTTNIELKSNIEGLEANEKQFKNIIDSTAAELKMNIQTIHKMNLDFEQLMDAYNEINQVVEQKTSRFENITALLKKKCDMISEYKNKLDTVIPDYEMLKHQVKERKESIERYKEEIEKLKMEKERQIEIIKDKLNLEEIKNVGLNEQLNQLNIKNVALVEELDNLKEKYEELQKVNSKLERKIRNSTSKVKAEAEMDELRDENKRLQNNLEGASNRVTEMQMDKNKNLREIVSLTGQYELVCQENVEIKRSLSLYKSKYITPCLSQENNKYDALLQEKNKIALELEGKKLLLNQKDKEIKELMNQLRDLDIKKKEFGYQLKEYTTIIYDREVEISELKNILHIQQCENKMVGELDHLQILKEKSEVNEKRIDDASYRNETDYYTLKRERSELQIKRNGYENKLELKNNSSNSSSASPAFETNRRRHSRNEVFNQRRQLDNIIFDTDTNENNEICQLMRKQIQELELQLVSQSGQIAALEIQIQSENFPYQKKCKELEELLLTFRNKNTELNTEIRMLQRTLNDINAWECETCRQWRINRREQACQSSPTNTLEYLKMDNGIMNNHAKIMKLEKEKIIIKGICRAQCQQVKNLEDKVRELEGAQTVSSSKRIQLLSERSIPECTNVMHSNIKLDLEKSKKPAMKENMPIDILMVSKHSSYEELRGIIINCEYIPEVSVYC